MKPSTLKRQVAVFAVTILASLGFSTAGLAQDAYPNKPIRVVVPFPAGGATDILTRSITEEMSKKMGKPIIVDNKPGGGANIGAAFVAKAEPDGYTLLMGSIGSHSIAMSYHDNVGYNFQKDLTPISKAGLLGNAVFVAPDFPANNLKELVDLVKANPGKYSCGSSGTGGLIHLTCEMFKSAAGLQVLHVPYKGTSLMIPDLLTGRVSMTLDTIPPYLSLLKSGKVKALAVTTASRSPLLPNVPTIAESGYPGFESVAAYGFFAPTGTPAPIINQLNKVIVDVLKDPALKSKMLESGIELGGSTPEELKTLVNGEVNKWAKVIKDGNLKPQ